MKIATADLGNKTLFLSWQTDNVELYLPNTKTTSCTACGGKMVLSHIVLHSPEEIINDVEM